MAFGGTAFKSLAVNTSNEIDHCDIAQFRSPCFGNWCRWPVFIGNAPQSFFNFFWVAVNFRTIDADFAKIRKRNFWHDFTSKRCFEILTVFIRFDINLWLACEPKIIAFDCLTGAFVKRLLDGIATNLVAKA